MIWYSNIHVARIKEIYNISVNFTGIVNNLELEKKKYINENVL